MGGMGMGGMGGMGMGGMGGIGGMGSPYPYAEGSHERVQTETFTVDRDDLNPLKPCGACHEWLKKIAEVNPQLRVVTFTDADCRGVHVEQIHD
ncbi:A distinct subfamily of CDD/CDA-like deaminases-domain-containing protein [Ochromonadaceae sp. CCMP2298]|nr:A distinct subfamily of CDD/CDA-like deaminases-domain-containing protein [Ochromonadaceae sp. CCMP2298]